MTIRARRSVRLEALVDTGATYTVIPAVIAKRIALQAAQPAIVRLADGTRRRFGAATATIRPLGTAFGDD